MNRTTYPNTRWQALTNPHCELCNSKNHKSGDCWLVQHAYYCGLIRGLLHADPALEQRYLEDRSPLGVDPSEIDEAIRPIMKWAAEQSERFYETA